MKNIHNRKDFIKIYEFGGTEGGVGSRDGFANNAKLKDTYLGKLINGIFSPIANLYRKSKSLFFINRLVAQLVNELMRGIILFCFDNNVDLKTGVIENKEEEIKSNVGEEEGEAGDVGEISATTTEKKLTKEQIEEKIASVSDDLKKAQWQKITMVNTIRQLNKDYTEETDKNKKVIKLNKIEKQQAILNDIIESIKSSEIYLAKLRQELSNLGDTTTKTDNLDSLKQACKNKYDFEPTSENLPNVAKGLGSISNTEFDQKFQKIASNTIKIGDEYSTIINGEVIDIIVTDVDNTKNKIFFDKNGQKMEVAPIRLLPKGFPNFNLLKVDADAFFNKYASMYDSMGDDNKKKMEILYMNYMQLLTIKQHQKSGLFEAISFLKDFDLLNEFTTKVKLDNPQAGKVGFGRSIEMKAGSSATVGDILNKRDKEKYKDKEEDFNLDVHSINLAEIEKTIVNIEKSNPGSNIKEKVSTYVNPYNLRTIQLSAEQLLAKQTTDGKSDDSLKLRWDKEVTKTYAAFTNLMDIEKVNIIKGDFGGLNNKKIETSVKGLTNDIRNQKAIAEVQNKLPIQTGTVNFKSLSDGLWCYGSINYKNVLYNISVAPVSFAFKQQIGLMQIPMAFDNIDATNHSSIENQEFDKLFKSKNNELNKTNINYINVYFVIKKGQIFPQSTKSYTFPIYVLNEYIYSDGSSQIFLKSNISSANNVLLSDNLFTNFNSEAYLHKFEALAFSKFIEIGFEEWRSAFKFSVNQKDYNYNDFQKNKPKFLQVNDVKTFDLLQKLSNTL
jgi:hypothetical protein